MALKEDRVAEPPNALLCDPIGWLYTEHQKHRRFCALLQNAASSPDYDEDLVQWLLDFVVHELGLHVRDEEDDLFPLMRARAQPEDEVDKVLGRLQAEHAKDLEAAAAVRMHLQACLRGRLPIGRNSARRRALEAFAAQERSHLALENAVVLPLARLRLTESDLLDLSDRLAKRRGMVGPPARRKEPARPREPLAGAH